MNQALVSPQLIYPSGEHQENARGLPTPRAKLANRGIRIPGFDLASYARSGFQTPTYVAWLMGAALAGSTESFNHLGGWDDRYFIYYEDHDIGLRAWDADLKLVLDPRSEWVHTWQRATTTLNRSAWKAELRSAWTFYRTYPELITRGRVNRSERFDHIGPLLWQTALDV
ncbi:glycosyltransferase family 2 protein [Aeromicrobium sp. UC242_57]